MLVPNEGFEPPIPKAFAFKANVYTVPPIRRVLPAEYDSAFDD